VLTIENLGEKSGCRIFGAVEVIFDFRSFLYSQYAE
jgi:hypothetical protein